MKKFFIAAIAVSVAAFTQAVQVDWTSGNLATAVANARTLGVDGTGSITAYYFVLSNDADAASLFNKTINGQLDSAEQQALYEQYKGQLDAAKADGRSSALVTRGSNVGTSWSQTLIPDAEEYVLALYVAENTYGGTYAMASVGHHVPATADEYEDWESEVTSGLGTMAYASGSGWTAVPEPTTVALLALGLAAVGLKRKIA